MVFRPYLFRQGSGKAGGELVPIWLPFYGQQLHVVLKAGGIGWVEHDPFPIVIGFCLIILLTNGMGKRASDPFKFCPLLFPEDDHKAHAMAFCVHAAKGFAASAVFVLVSSILADAVP